MTKQIENKLYKLKALIESLTNHDINPQEPELWDPDYYYDLTEQLKEALQVLEGKKSFNKYGELITLEEGLCSLMDDYQEEENE